jgi:DNA-binding NarL/FixJ family response regulator
MQRRPYLLIADDTMMAQCLQRLLEYEFPGVEIVPEGQALLDSVVTLRPDLLLIDFKMPGLDGLEAMRQLRAASPTTRILVVTMHDEPEYVDEALRSGASGFVLKWCAVSELVAAIRGVLDGRSHMTAPRGDPSASPVTNRKGRPNGKGRLTVRQGEVLQLVAQGRTAKEIANALGLSVKTAVFHKMALMDKLGLHTTADLTRYAMQHGILRSTMQPESLSAMSMPLATTATSV